MRMTVAVVPGLLVMVVAARWEEAVERLRQVLAQARLELDHADRGRAADVEDVNDAGADRRFGNASRHLCRQIVHVAGACCRDGELFLKRHDVYSSGSNE